MAVKPIPEGYQTLSCSLAVDNASEAIEFYKKAFGAQERGRMEGPGGTIAHAELQVGDSVLDALRSVSPRRARSRRRSSAGPA